MTIKEILTSLAKVFLTRLPESPKAVRYLLILVISTLVGICLTVFVGCGSVTKITVKSDNPNQTTISVNQSKKDSSSTAVTINPTINLNTPNVSKDETKTK